MLCVQVQLGNCHSGSGELDLHRSNGGPGPRPFSAQAAVRLVARVATRLCWPHTVVHDLRRTFAVHALGSGIPLARVQRWLGHRTPAMTLRYAQHAPEPHADDDAARVEASMGGVANREAQALQALLKVVEA